MVSAIMQYCGPQVLANLACVNATYQAEATLRLYCHLEFGLSSRNQMIQCMETLVERSKHAKLVRSLTLVLDDHSEYVESELLKEFATIIPIAMRSMANLVHFCARLPLDEPEFYPITSGFFEYVLACKPS